MPGLGLGERAGSQEAGKREITSPTFQKEIEKERDHFSFRSNLPVGLWGWGGRKKKKGATTQRKTSSPDPRPSIKTTGTEGAPGHDRHRMVRTSS